MTSEKRILVQPDDIVSIEFLCPACKVRISYDEMKQSNDAITPTCPVCKTVWLTPQESDGVYNFLSGLLAMQGSSALAKMVRLRLSIRDGEV